MCNNKCAQAIAIDPAEAGGNVKPLMLTREQVELLDEMMRQDIVDFPEAYADSLPFKALYSRVQIMLATW